MEKNIKYEQLINELSNLSIYNSVNLLFLFFFLFSNSNFAQRKIEAGLPFIQNYSPKHYNAESQNWSIIQDKRGVLYFGNNTGILEYDGLFWRLFTIPNHTTIRSLAIDENGTIYVGSTGDFGYLKLNNIGAFEYISLFKNLSNYKFNDTWKIFATTNGVYFFAGRSLIFKYFNSKLTPIHLPANISEFRGFCINNQIYAVDFKYGLGKIVGDSLVFFNIGTDISKNNVYCMLPFENNTIIIGTATKGLYLFNPNNNKITKFNSDADDYFVKNRIYYGIKQNDSTYIFSTLLAGIVIINQKGELIKIINKAKGLISNGIYTLFIDKQKNLWAGLEKGISQIRLNSPYYKFNEINGIESSLTNITKHNHTIYIATYSGLYYLPNNSTVSPEKAISFLPVTKNYIYIQDFLHYKTKRKNLFIVSTLRAIIEVIDSVNVREIKTLYGCASLCVSNKKKNRIFMGHTKGLTSMLINENENGIITYQDEENIKGLDENITQIIKGQNNDYWLGTSHQGLINLRFSDDESLDKPIITKYDTLAGLPEVFNIKPFMINGRIVFSTRRGLYSITDKSYSTGNHNLYKFQPDTSFGMNYSKDSAFIFKIAEDSKQNVWFSTSKGFYKFDFATKQLISKTFKNITEIDKENSIFVEENGIAWLGSPETLYRYDQSLDKENPTTNFALIRKVILGNNQLLFAGGDSNTGFSNEGQHIIYKTSLKHDENSLTFEFALPAYENEKTNKFKSFLEGYETQWSNWSSKSERSYTNLKPGKYRFHVLAKNIFDITGKEAIFEFEISSPWYNTSISYFIYAILFLLVYFFGAKLYALRLKKTNIKLENLVKIRTAELEEQKEKIKAQTEQLISQSESLILTNNELKHLSLVAQDTDNSVAILNHKGAFEWWNKGFTRLFSYQFDQFKDTDFREFQRQLRPDLLKAIKEYKGGKESKIYTTYLKFDTIHEIWFQTTLTPVFDDAGKLFRFVAIDSDITKIKLAEREIEQQKEEIQAQAEQLLEKNKQLEKLSLVARETDNSIILLDSEGNIEWVNEGFTRLFGYSFDEFKQNPSIRPGFQEAIDYCLIHINSYDYTSIVTTKDGIHLWIQTTFTPILNNENSIIRYIVIDSDVTKIKRAQEEIKKQHAEIEAQRDYIAKQNQEITDSILYASRIQNAMLPLDVFTNSVLSDYFIFSQPRNIVSGDFYWVAYKNEKTIFAVADSTGHGVPGAFMCMLGLTSLKEILSKKDYQNANEILNELREWIILSLHQSGKVGEANDGMDIALCILDYNELQLQYAGANNPLYLVRNTKDSEKLNGKKLIIEDLTLTEIKADKMPIGIHYSNEFKPFTNHTIQLQTDDTIYIFTDGFVDQFGGPYGKKFFSKQLKTLLMNINSKPMNHQKEILESTIEEWKGNLEQVDDILVMGVKV